MPYKAGPVICPATKVTKRFAQRRYINLHVREDLCMVEQPTGQRFTSFNLMQSNTLLLICDDTGFAAKAALRVQMIKLIYFAGKEVTSILQTQNDVDAHCK